ncbi:MAG: CaiB/BaiF CoA-transferase family protein [bacterium]|nr:CaiB/BaiF CoA-transferase family protein [bacterium]
MTQPEPLRIVDFSTHMSGPLASHLLVEMGADVIKVEHPVQGDGNRGNEPKIAGISDLHLALNPGTRSIAISTRSPHWSDVVAGVTAWADAVIVGSRPKDAVRRGLDFHTLLEANPQLVYCVISGYGLTGPWAEYKAHGQNMDALAGRVEVDWNDGHPQTQVGWRSAGVLLAGVFGAMGVLAAIVKRDRGGGPQFVHTSIWNTALWWNWRDVNTWVNNDEPWHEYRALGSRYSMYATSDLRALLICPLEKVAWERFCDLTGLDHLSARGEWTHSMDFGYDDEFPLIADAISRRSFDDWTRLLNEAEIPFAPILTLDEAVNSEHAQVNRVLRGTEVPGGRVQMAASPVQLSSNPDEAAQPGLSDLPPPPDLGSDTDKILAEVGLDHLVGEDLSGGSR